MFPTTAQDAVGQAARSRATRSEQRLNAHNLHIRVCDLSQVRSNAHCCLIRRVQGGVTAPKYLLTRRSMAIQTTENLLDDARNGQKLGVEDRRRVVRYLMYIQPELSNTETAEIFQVTEGTIRNDKKIIREEMAEELRNEDVGLVISDIAFNFRRQLRDLEKSKAKCQPGTKEYRQHCESILKIELDKTKAFQELGYLPKNLGNLTMEKYEYAAVVIKGDQVESRPLTMFDDDTQAQIKARSAKLLESGEAPIVEAEFTELPARETTFAPKTVSEV